MTRKHIAFSSAVQTLARFVVLVCGMIAFVYLSRSLGAINYGTYSVSFLVTQWCALPITLLVGGATVPMVAGHDQGQRYAKAILHTALLFGSGVALVVFFASPWLASLLRSPGLEYPLRIMAIDIPLSTVAGIYLLILTGQGRFTSSAVIYVCYWLVRMAMAFLLVERGFSLQGAAAAMPLASAIQCLLGWILSGLPILSSDRMSFTNVFGYSRTHAASGFAQRMIDGMDLVAVKVLLTNPGAAGVYAAAQNICLTPQVAYAGTVGVILQSLARHRKDGRLDEENRLFQDYLRLTLIFAGLTVAMCTSSTQIAVFLFGPSFASAGPVAGVLLFGTTFRNLTACGRTLIAARGERAKLVLPLFLFLGLALVLYSTVALSLGQTLDWFGSSNGTIGFAIIAALISLLVCLASLVSAIHIGKIAFPWTTFFRSVVSAALAAVCGLYLPGTGFVILGKILVIASVYMIIQLALGEWRVVVQMVGHYRSARLRRSLELNPPA